MSGYYGNYSQYLGAQKCCSIKTQGSQGPAGPTGPAAIGIIGYTGPTGPSSISNAVTTLTLNSQSITIPSQNQPIAYYTVDLTNGDNLSSVTFTSLPTGYQAIVFITTTTLTTGQTATIGTPTSPSVLSGINYYNLNAQQTLSGTTSTLRRAILTINNDGTFKYGNLVTYY
jgi:hypothetical protein